MLLYSTIFLDSSLHWQDLQFSSICFHDGYPIKHPSLAPSPIIRLCCSPPELSLFLYSGLLDLCTEQFSGIEMAFSAFPCNKGIERRTQIGKIEGKKYYFCVSAKKKPPKEYVGNEHNL